MDDSNRIKAVKFPRLALFANYNELSFILVKKLLNYFFGVEVFTNQKNLWQEKIKQEKLFVEIKSPKDARKTLFEYIISLNINSPQQKFDKKFLMSMKNDIVIAAQISKKSSSKCLFIFSYKQEKNAFEILSSWIKEILNNKNILAGVIYLGEIISDKEPLIGNNGLSSFLKSYIKNTPIIILKDEKYFYPVRIEEATNEIIRSLFSLKAYGTETAIISRPISNEEIISNFKIINPNLRFSLTDKKQNLITPDTNNYIYKDFNYLNFLLQLTEKYSEKELLIERGSEEQNVSSQSPEHKEMKRRSSKFFFKIKKAIQNYLSSNKQRRAAILLMLAIIVFLSFPWLLFGVSLSCLSIAKTNYEGGNIDLGEKSLEISKTVSSVNEKYSTFLTGLPVLGNSYNYLVDSSTLSINASAVGLRIISLSNKIINLSNQIVNENTIYDPSDYAEDISLDLEILYRDLGFLEGDFNDYQTPPSRTLKKILGNINILDFRERVLFLMNISKELPIILGKDKNVNYLVLFQNNLRLAPTGGVIEAVGFITLTNGKLTGLKIYKSDDIDKLLKGYVEPPEPIYKYFEKKTWSLKDSNWDPDFSISAARAEWFIDKELDRVVDGVIGLDLEFLKAFIKQTGTLKIEKTEERVTSENISKLLKEKGPDFFMQFSQEFLTKVFKINSKQKILLSKAVTKGLKERHLQVFLHHLPVQRTLSDLHWTGEVDQVDCKGNCYSDLFVLIEAEIGDSGFNDSVKKEINLEVFFERDLIKRKLVFFIDNSKNGLLVGKYKTYVRVLVPEDSSFEPVGVYDGETKKSIDPEVYGIRGHKEAGVFIELLPGETKALIFSWESGIKINYNKKGEYLLLFRKQAGALDYPVEIKLSFPEYLKVVSTPTFSLTEERFVGYNTLLSQDFTSRIFW